MRYLAEHAGIGVGTVRGRLSHDCIYATNHSHIMIANRDTSFRQPIGETFLSTERLIMLSRREPLHEVFMRWVREILAKEMPGYRTCWYSIL